MKSTIEIENFQTKDIHALTKEEVFKALSTTGAGLSSSEATARQNEGGKNKLAEPKKKSALLVFLGNFTHLMALLLWVGGIIAFFADLKQLAVAIWLVNIINGLFSFFQERKADQATDALKNMLPSYTRVIREGKEEKILAEDLVVGDIMLLEEGDKLSADGRLIETSDLQIEQSALTGESNPVRKTKDPVLSQDLTHSEMPNLIFAGTNVSEGNGKAVVTEIGMNTEFGKIAYLTQNMEKEESPLQKELERLTKQVSIIAVLFGLAFFLTAFFFVGEPLVAAFIFSLGMIVAFIPEGLLPTVTLSLAKAVQRMSKKNALVKKLSSVETLGSTTVICTDKTGTLTQNEMTVSNLWLPEKEYEVTGVGYEAVGEIQAEGVSATAEENSPLYMLLGGAALCSNAKLLPPNEESEKYTVLGDPTEACLGVVAKKAGIDMEDAKAKLPRLRELPFESRRKRMSTIHALPQGNQLIAFTKGAPKEVVDICSEVHGSQGRIPMNSETKERIMKANDSYARQGLRVLALAYKDLEKKSGRAPALSEYTVDTVENNLIFVGLIAMVDPPRPEVKDAVEQCHKAGIRIVMITGDYGLTAESIAKRIGIVKGNNPRVVSGLELEKIDDPTLKEYLKDEVIFARVAPEQKLRVVSNLQEMDEIVAVTGDGVNDSPALKKANIGIAMGIAGTDVAKEAADMILIDDNFASIVHAIEEGRAVYSNIRKFLIYIFNSNMAEAVPSAMFLVSKGAIPLPLTIMQILAIDLGTDMVPALGLGVEKPEKGVMEQPPRDRKEPLLNKSVILKAFLWYGLLASGALVVSYFFANRQNGWPAIPLAGEGIAYRKATTMALGAIVFCQIGAIFNCRTEKQSVFRIGLFSNSYINIGIISEVILLALLAYVPFLQNMFNTAPLKLSDWLFLCIWPPIILFVEEFRKFLVRKKSQKI